jgi:hypothetical protein
LYNTAFPRYENAARKHTGGNDDDSGVDGVDNITLNEYTTPDGMDKNPDEEGNNAPSKPNDVPLKRNNALRMSKVGAGK